MTQDEGRPSIGRVIRTVRKSQGLSRRELAEATTAAPPGPAVSAKTLEKIEKDQKPPSTGALASLVRAFGVEDPELDAMGEQIVAQTAGGSVRRHVQSIAIANSGIGAGGALGLAPGVGVVDGAAAMAPLKRLSQDYRAALERRLRALAAAAPAPEPGPETHEPAEDTT